MRRKSAVQEQGGPIRGVCRVMSVLLFEGMRVSKGLRGGLPRLYTQKALRARNSATCSGSQMHNVVCGSCLTIAGALTVLHAGGSARPTQQRYAQEAALRAGVRVARSGQRTTRAALTRLRAGDSARPAQRHGEQRSDSRTRPAPKRDQERSLPPLDRSGGSSPSDGGSGPSDGGSSPSHGGEVASRGTKATRLPQRPLGGLARRGGGSGSDGVRRAPHSTFPFHPPLCTTHSMLSLLLCPSFHLSFCPSLVPPFSSLSPLYLSPLLCC